MPESQHPAEKQPRPLLAIHSDGSLEVNVRNREELDDCAARLLTAIARGIYDEKPAPSHARGATEP